MTDMENDMEALLDRLPDGGKAVRAECQGRIYPRRWSLEEEPMSATMNNEPPLTEEQYNRAIDMAEQILAVWRAEPVAEREARMHAYVREHYPELYAEYLREQAAKEAKPAPTAESSTTSETSSRPSVLPPRQE